jgi:hypothetical protein
MDSPGSPLGPLWRETPISRVFFYTFPSKSLVNEPPSMFPKQGPYGERSFISGSSGLFILLYLAVYQVRSPPMKNRENIWSLSMEPHVDGRPTYSGVRPSSSRRLFTTLQSLPQCYTAFSTIPSTLAWVDQSPIIQHVS